MQLMLTVICMASGKQNYKELLHQTQRPPAAKRCREFCIAIHPPYVHLWLCFLLYLEINPSAAKAPYYECDWIYSIHVYF